MALVEADAPAHAVLNGAQGEGAAEATESDAQLALPAPAPAAVSCPAAVASSAAGDGPPPCLPRLARNGPPVVLLLTAALAAGGLLLLRAWRSRARRSVLLRTRGACLAEVALQPAPDPAPPLGRLPLSGLTFAVKDVFDVAGRVTGFGSPTWAATHAPAARSAHAVAALQRGGARGVFVAVSDELAFSILGENHHFGTPHNPAAPGCVPGGSSSGSASAVAQGLVDFALGSDTGGSIRVPAACCGLFGFRPSWGVVPVDGLLPMAPSLDSVGWLARDADTLAAVGGALLPPQPCAGPGALATLVVAEDCLDGVAHSCVAAVAALAAGCAAACPSASAARVALGAVLLADCPALAAFCPGGAGPGGGADGLAALRAAFRSLQGAELWALHNGWLEATKPRLGPGVADRVAFAASVTAAAAADARAARDQARACLRRLLPDDAVLVLPTLPGPPPGRGLPPAGADAWRADAMRLLSVVGMAGLCCVHLPLGADSKGLPLGVALAAAPGTDRQLLALARALAGPATAALASQPPAGGDAGSPRRPLPAATAPFVPPPAAGDGGRAADEAEAARLRGNAAFARGQWAEASRHYSVGLERAPASTVLLANRALARLKAGDCRAAEDDCDAVLRLDAGSVKALLRRGAARAMRGAYGEALADFEAAAAREPHNKDARAELDRIRRLADA